MKILVLYIMFMPPQWNTCLYKPNYKPFHKFKFTTQFNMNKKAIQNKDMSDLVIECENDPEEIFNFIKYSARFTYKTKKYSYYIGEENVINNIKSDYIGIRIKF